MKSTFLFLFSLLIFSTTNIKAVQQEDTIPVHETFTLASTNLAETRVINVWKPAEYSNGSIKLPVLYMLDGGVKEDFPHLANTLSELVSKKVIPPIMLVGIENTQRRRDLTGYTAVEEDKKIAPIVGGSAKFRAFIKEELFPAVEQKYRVSEDKSIIGESLAGLFIVETLLTDPSMFDNYIAFDPSLWWNDHQLVKTGNSVMAKFPTENKRFWFASSNTKEIYTFTKKLSKILNSTKISNLKWAYHHYRNTKHDTIFRASKKRALIWTFGND
ncbi:alpha/beta hydrolase [Pedobacter namyangjuensis]|uniref:alpha/beta hydrolase n=1 Tax=Pedobacter namyangjuensis TaxID=600626 RepID=UPI000DE3BA22|nr:alpha/beta hydrolase-fold protein [Pedobacter namyangjuensis]